MRKEHVIPSRISTSSASDRLKMKIGWENLIQFNSESQLLFYISGSATKHTKYSYKCVCYQALNKHHNKKANRESKMAAATSFPSACNIIHHPHLYCTISGTQVIFVFV